MYQKQFGFFGLQFSRELSFEARTREARVRSRYISLSLFRACDWWSNWMRMKLASLIGVRYGKLLLLNMYRLVQ